MAIRTLAKDLAEKDSRARDNRRVFQGRVVDRDNKAFTVEVDVGEPENLKNIPYSPQIPPAIGDLVPLEYANSSTHSVRVGVGKLSPQNDKGGITIVGGVTTLRANTETKLKGDITLAEGTNVTLTQVGHTITISATPGTSISIGDPIGDSVDDSVLYIGTGGVLAQDAGKFTYQESKGQLKVTAVDLATDKAILATELTSSTNDVQASIQASRECSAPTAQGFGTGFVIAIAEDGGGFIQVGAVTAERDFDPARWALCFRTARDGNNSTVWHINSRGDLISTPKAGSGAYGLQVPNIDHTSVTSPLGGAIVYKDGVLSYYDHIGTTWIDLVSGASVTPGSVAGQIDIGDSASDGTGTAYARANHQHAFPAPAAGYPTEVGATEDDGTDTRPARSDHRHRGVHSVDGGGADLYGDITIAGAGSVSVSQSGQTITITGGTIPSAANSAPPDIASAAATGSDTTHYALDDHTHKGVRSLAKTSGTQLFGDVTLTEGSGITITQSGNALTIASSGGASSANSTPVQISYQGVTGSDTTHFANDDHTHARWNMRYYATDTVPNLGGEDVVDGDIIAIDTAGQTYNFKLPTAAAGKAVWFRRFGTTGAPHPSITAFSGDTSEVTSLTDGMYLCLVAIDADTWKKFS